MNKRLRLATPLLFLSLFFFLSFLPRLTAQPFDEFDLRNQLGLAEDKYDRGDLYNALAWYERAWQTDPTNTKTIARLAVTNYRIRDYDAAQQWYVRLIGVDAAGEFPEAQFYYARCLKMNNFQEDAGYHFDLFVKNYKGKYSALRQLALAEIQGIQQARLAVRDTAVRIVNAGNKINSPYSEFAPMPAADGTLFFSALKSDSILILKDQLVQRKNTAQIYKTSYEMGSFLVPQLLKGDIDGQETHVGNTALTTDGNTMFYSKCELANNILTHCDIYAAKHNADDSWTTMPTNFAILNSPLHTTKQPACGTWKGREGLFFASNRKGGFGGFDLYFTPKNEAGVWGNPENLGATINTIGNEETPFYDAKQDALFFSSDGLPTYGGYDIFFIAGLNKKTAPVKQTPINAGRGINSMLDDLYFTIDNTSQRGFLVSNRPGTTSLRSPTCCDDIFVAYFPSDFFLRKQLNLTTNSVFFTITDVTSGLPIPAARVKLQSASGELIERITDTKGTISLNELETGNFYSVEIKKQGYYNEKRTLFLDGTVQAIKENVRIRPTENVAAVPNGDLKTAASTPPKRSPLPLVVTPSPVNPPVKSYELPKELPKLQEASRAEAIELHSIRYDFAKSDLRADALLILDSIANTLLAHPTLFVEIGSHTDNKGSAAANQKLSEARSFAALRYLASRGVAINRLVPVGYGAEKPAAPNAINGIDNEEGRALNRRTEFRIIEQASVPPPPLK